MNDGNADPGAAVTAYLGLGANLGDTRATLLAALAAIAALPRTQLVARSAWYRTAPIDATGPDFLNAVARIETMLAPEALLDGLQAIERQHGRERPYRNAPRTLDLDVLIYGDQTFTTPRLQVPHPRLHERAFALEPLAELWPQGEVPGLGPIARLLPAVADQAIERLDDAAP